MMQIGRPSMLKGINLGWKRSEAFSEGSFINRGGKHIRENRLKAAIRRLQFAKEAEAAK